MTAGTIEDKWMDEYNNGKENSFSNIYSTLLCADKEKTFQVWSHLPGNASADEEKPVVDPETPLGRRGFDRAKPVGLVEGQRTHGLVGDGEGHC